MRLCTFRRPDGRTAPGRLLENGEEGVQDLAGSIPLEGPPPTDLGELCRHLPLPGLRDRLETLEPRHGPVLARDEVELVAPIPRPPKVAAVGLNYRDHAEEQGKTPPERPLVFAKARTSVTGPTGPIRLPADPAARVDPEVELCVVFGREASGLAPEDVPGAVLGLTVADDVSDRAAQRSDGQWYRAKSHPTFCPTGPWILAFEVDEGDRAIEMRVDGELRQASRTSRLIFGVRELARRLTAFQPVEPGDLLLTGTPGGVGVFRDPPVFLEGGEVCRASVAGVGAIENRVVAADGGGA